ncbi:hypothetical protein GJ744_006373 [Endocarpon pusillum]|uniref:Mitochondrial import inner membrane translocase subunit Tim21 n=1 Tax=Endocarpon pusillum TaxID=364733 RepID=A0A8H7AM12_9EURO|nr:hypothetical protein GJ744_006373 [Endocarpon pusillum]
MAAAAARAFQLACRARHKPLVQITLAAQCSTKTAHQGYATQSSPGASTSSSTNTPRRAVTVTTDDGRYKWSDLSTREKAARSTQQSFNLALVVAGAVGTLTVIYFLYQELFAADSKTRQFNHAVDRVRADSRCTELLGPAKEIKAYGEPTSNKWARARPLAHSVEVDKLGVTHFKMHFHVEGPKDAGVVNLHMTKGKGDEDLQYKYLSLNVNGHPTVYLENADEKSPKKTVAKMFGVQWR